MKPEGLSGCNGLIETRWRLLLAMNLRHKLSRGPQLQAGLRETLKASVSDPGSEKSSRRTLIDVKTEQQLTEDRCWISMPNRNRPYGDSKACRCL